MPKVTYALRVQVVRVSDKAFGVVRTADISIGQTTTAMRAAIALWEWSKIELALRMLRGGH